MSRLNTFFALMALGGILGVTLVMFAPQPPKRQPIEWMEKPRHLREFRLNSEAGTITNQTLKGRWHIVSFGFLNCVDVCPTNLAELATLADSLAEQPVARDINFIFVSVDPGRDSIAAIKPYVRHFSGAIKGVTGSEDQLTLFAEDLGIQFSVKAQHENYSVAHSTTFSIIDPAGVLRGRFRPGFDVSALLKNLTTKIKEASA